MKKFKIVVYSHVTDILCVIHLNSSFCRALYISIIY